MVRNPGGGLDLVVPEVADVGLSRRAAGDLSFRRERRGVDAVVAEFREVLGARK
jgi:hypothetical protein